MEGGSSFKAMLKTTDIRAFTLPEIIVAMVIVGVLATLAIPNLSRTSERMRAEEGVQFLFTLLAAQKRYSINNDNGDATPDYADNLAQLDVDVSVTLQNFLTPTNADINTTSPVAKITRTGGTPYTLFIRDTGVITCNCGGAACQVCNSMGYALGP